jgi:hypothetical protein
LPPLTEDSLPAAGREGIDVEIEEQCKVQIRKSQVQQDLLGVHRASEVPETGAHSAFSYLSEPSVSRCWKGVKPHLPPHSVRT